LLSNLARVPAAGNIPRVIHGRRGLRTNDKQRRYDLSLPSADYPAWHGQPRRTIAICTQQRCGSTLLGEAIYFAGGLGCPLEYCHGLFKTDFQARWNSPDFPTYVAALHRHRTDTTGVFSIKLFWRDWAEIGGNATSNELECLSGTTAARTPPEIYRRLFAHLSPLLPNFTPVLLTRRDTIRQAVSLLIASRSGKWRRFSDRSIGAGAREVIYSFDEVFRYVVRMRENNVHWLNFFFANGLSCHQIFYEDLAQDYDITVRDLFNKLGRPDAPIAPPRLRKQSDARSEEFVQCFLADFHQRARG